MIDILWILVCSGLVFAMQAGFMCLESGLTRSKNSINVAVKNLADFGISVTLFTSVGYALMFGASQGGWWGNSYWFLHFDQTPFKSAIFLFQVMFCSTATTIVSGAIAERIHFSAYLLVACLISGCIYPLFGHWAWNGLLDGQALGWLGKLGFVDFAGATVVHSMGGWVSLAALLVIGPRLGRFPAPGKSRKIQGSNLPLAVLGALILWFGWLGFNGGSTFELSPKVPHILLNTILAGVAGMLVATALTWQRRKVPEVEMVINGSIAGLVAITAACNLVSAPLALVIGGTGAAVMVLVSSQLEQWQIDDAVDAVAVHGAAGFWGTLAVGLFGNPELIGTGLSKGSQIAVQFFGASVALIWGFGITYIILKSINRYFPLRVNAEAEQAGLNVSEHQATTELHDLFAVMEKHAQSENLSLRVPVDPFTEVGQIAKRYNQVMDALETANEEISQLNEQLKADNLRLSAELDITRQLQQMLLPREKDLEAIADLDISGFMEPAAEIGGDYYDILNYDGRIKIGIGDVTGHGLESGVLMIMVQTAVRTLLANNEQDPKKFWDTLNRTIYANVQRMGSEKNLTLSLLDYYEGKLCVSGQHEELIIVRANGDIERIDTINLGFPIGLDHDIRDFVDQTYVQLFTGDIAVVYTDGITEAENLAGEHYGLNRLCHVVKKHRHLKASKIQQAVVDDIRQHIGSHTVYDDITLVVLKQKEV
ncbi:ammonium transporter [Spirulina subsalsa]|nr:ammonium transporter [Spirulina subsalsa]